MIDQIGELLLEGYSIVFSPSHKNGPNRAVKVIVRYKNYEIFENVYCYEIAKGPTFVEAALRRMEQTLKSRYENRRIVVKGVEQTSNAV